ncbi:hypothetical protein GAO09_14690 [Rhizobiales bacterium RZME27]|uniref:Uncharacterized protein n=1 Tax=Endobacterium cereale TaxID=2663029 RepID=A0A6A8A7T5_9HYPH|nr:hypothetical protein [Endobacterium cereale]MEB2843325.1 hypothetical protein [Endobacterium cereale]MQY47283.1 hypothetical protein [Endobacterium cereale]
MDFLESFLTVAQQACGKARIYGPVRCGLPKRCIRNAVSVCGPDSRLDLPSVVEPGCQAMDANRMTVAAYVAAMRNLRLDNDDVDMAVLLCRITDDRHRMFQRVMMSLGGFTSMA